MEVVFYFPHGIIPGTLVMNVPQMNRKCTYWKKGILKYTIGNSLCWQHWYQ